MIANKINQKIQMMKEKKTNIMENKNSANSEAQQKRLERLEKVIFQIKRNLDLIANDRLKLVINKNGNVQVTDTKEVFGHTVYDKDTHSSKRGDIDFFEFYKNSEFHETLNDFKLWLHENGIKTIIIGWTHCGGGISDWNTYSAKVN